MAKTLPVKFDDGITLDDKEAREFGENLMGNYCFAEPFPHIVIDNFLPDEFANHILNKFPLNRNQNDKTYNNGYEGLLKRQISPIGANKHIREIFSFFNSAPFLIFLERLTNIEGLIPDPYFVGAGFHEINPGGLLGVHADFRINEKLHLQRRINVLIYLNKNWKSDYGAELELWDRKMSRMDKSIEPIFNRCVIFNTDANSYHGHPNPLKTTDGYTRKSIALYYYTASHAVYQDTISNCTSYKARPTDGLSVRFEVMYLQSINFLKDLLPPIFFRAIIRYKNKLSPLKKLFKKNHNNKNN
jgi:hypothetical protein